MGFEQGVYGVYGVYTGVQGGYTRVVGMPPYCTMVGIPPCICTLLYHPGYTTTLYHPSSRTGYTDTRVLRPERRSPGLREGERPG